MDLIGSLESSNPILIGNNTSSRRKRSFDNVETVSARRTLTIDNANRHGTIYCVRLGWVNEYANSGPSVLSPRLELDELILQRGGCVEIGNSPNLNMPQAHLKLAKLSGDRTGWLVLPDYQSLTLAEDQKYTVIDTNMIVNA